MHRLITLLLVLVTSIVACSPSSTSFKSLDNTQEIVVQNNDNEVLKNITDEERIDQIVNVIQDAKKVNLPQKARGIDISVAEQSLLLLFKTFNDAEYPIVYIGDGFIYDAKDVQYYKVNSKIDELLMIQD